MRTYTVLYAEDVPHYGTREIEAADDDLAIQRAIDITPDAMSKYTQDPDQNNPQFRRIVHIEGPDGTIAEGIYLDTDDKPAVRGKEVLQALERAFDLLEGIADKLLYEEGHPVTFLETREIEDIYNDAICELAPFETLIRKARGEA